MPSLHSLCGVVALLLCAAAAARAQLAPAPDPTGADAVDLSIDSVVIQGIGPDTLSEADILDVDVDLCHVAGGWVGRREGLPSVRWKLGQLSGLGIRLYGSALRSLAEAVSLAHFAAGHSRVRVELRGGAVARRVGDLELRNLVVELRREEGAAAVPAAPAAPERYGPDAVLLTVRGIALEGGEGLGVSEEELLRLELDLSWDPSQIPPGYVSPRRGSPPRRVALWELGRFRPQGEQLYGSAVQALLARVAQALYERGVYGVTVDLAPGAVRHLATPGSDGLLVIQIRRDS
jgi:hypothetical protein